MGLAPSGGASFQTDSSSCEVLVPIFSQPRSERAHQAGGAFKIHLLCSLANASPLFPLPPLLPTSVIPEFDAFSVAKSQISNDKSQINFKFKTNSGLRCAISR